MRFWTFTLTSGTLQISDIDGANFLSLQCDTTSGKCTVRGGIPFKGVQPTAVGLNEGQGANFSALSPASPLDGITITWVVGSIDIIIGF